MHLIFLRPEASDQALLDRGGAESVAMTPDFVVARRGPSTRPREVWHEADAVSPATTAEGIPLVGTPVREKGCKTVCSPAS